MVCDHSSRIVTPRSSTIELGELACPLVEQQRLDHQVEFAGEHVIDWTTPLREGDPEPATHVAYGWVTQVVILDEILGSIKAGLVDLEQVLALVADKPADLHLVLTGRGAPPELVEVADLVTEMRPIKHPYEAGIMAQRGVEF